MSSFDTEFDFFLDFLYFVFFEQAVVTYLKFFPESLFWFLRIICYFVELSYPVLNVGCVYPCRVKGLVDKTMQGNKSKVLNI